MLPSLINKQKNIAVRKDKFLSERQTMLMIPEIVEKLNSLQLEIAQAGVEMPVRKYDKDTLIKKSAILVKFICKDYGIVNMDEKNLNYSATRFVTTIKKRYNDLSLKEIKMAFELAAVGELDQWLPRDKNGAPDNKHYNSFNMEYFTKILNAYKKKKGSVWSTVHRLIPKEKIVTEEEKDATHIEFINDIYEAFDNYIVNKVEPNFINSIYVKEFILNGLIQEEPVPNKQVIDKVYRTILSKLRGNERKKMIDDYYSGKIGEFLMNEAKTVENNKAIVKVFDEIIDKDQHIKDVLKLTDK